MTEAETLHLYLWLGFMVAVVAAVILYAGLGEWMQQNSLDRQLALMAGISQAQAKELMKLLAKEMGLVLCPNGPLGSEEWVEFCSLVAGQASDCGTSLEKGRVLALGYQFGQVNLRQVLALQEKAKPLLQSSCSRRPLPYRFWR